MPVVLGSEGEWCRWCSGQRVSGAGGARFRGLVVQVVLGSEGEWCRWCSGQRVSGASGARVRG